MSERVRILGQSRGPKEEGGFPTIPVQKREMSVLVSGNHGEIFEYKCRAYAQNNKGQATVKPIK